MKMYLSDLISATTGSPLPSDIYFASLVPQGTSQHLHSHDNITHLGKTQGQQSKLFYQV